MSAREFQEWQAYYRIEPFGDDWLQAGTIAAAAISPYSKRKVKPQDFMPKPQNDMTPEQQRARLTQFAEQHNARNAKRRGQQT